MIGLESKCDANPASGIEMCVAHGDANERHFGINNHFAAECFNLMQMLEQVRSPTATKQSDIDVHGCDRGARHDVRYPFHHFHPAIAQWKPSEKSVSIDSVRQLCKIRQMGD